MADKNTKTNHQVERMVRLHEHKIDDIVFIKELNKNGKIKKIYDNGILKIRVNFKKFKYFICGGGAVININNNAV